MPEPTRTPAAFSMKDIKPWFDKYQEAIQTDSMWPDPYQMTELGNEYRIEKADWISQDVLNQLEPDIGRRVKYSKHWKAATPTPTATQTPTATPTPDPYNDQLTANDIIRQSLGGFSQ